LEKFIPSDYELPKQKMDPGVQSPRVIFMIPFAGPYSGKSFTWEEMEESITKSSELKQYSTEWSFASVSSDKIGVEGT